MYLIILDSRMDNGLMIEPKVKEYTITLMEPNMRVNGTKINR